jgi:carbonic anhydrase/acetyltransferase-like protein (isoleucine patch superfamily)
VKPRVHPSAYVAPTAIVSGDVSIGEGSCILHGSVIHSETGPVRVGQYCIIMENAVVRGTKRHPAILGDHILVGPSAHLSGCKVDDNVFLATGSSVFNGAHLETRSTVRIHGIVHIKTRLPADSVVPIGWVALGDPARIMPPHEHESISEALTALNFPRTVFGLERARPGESIMPQLTTRYSKSLRRHLSDKVLATENAH